jgi:lipopolysaccharide transport system ATP-binding protein
VSGPIITVENLSKRYRIGIREKGYRTFREAIVDAFSTPVRNLRRLVRLTRFDSDAAGEAKEINQNGIPADVIWALRGVSFEVKEGEVLGIIGRNGAGKSTLLKILSRITEPSMGDVKIYGRVSSLLEVGTGFHPELTGRENIYLNGAILGMRKTEIERKFDEIVAFAEIGKFIDTPVKRYSSGMYVRLAFAVAAHLEPEILLVDEILAVGDMAFQKKCLGKMGDVAREGRTVLFVSHNMSAVRALCPRSLLLQEGMVIADGPTSDTQTEYYKGLQQVAINAQTDVMNTLNRRGSGEARFTGIRVEDEKGNASFSFVLGSTIRFVLSYLTFAAVDSLYVSILLRSGMSGEVITSVRHLVSAKKLAAGYKGSLVIEFPELNLRPGEYPLYFHLADRPNRALDVIDDLTAPLTIHTDKGFEQLGFEAARPSGFFNIESKMSILEE